MADSTATNWSFANKPPPKPPSAPSNAFASLSLKPSPLPSRTTSPAGVLASQNSSATKKGNDSFSNLVSFGRDKQSSSLSLLEQQKKLEEQRRKDDEERQRKMDALFGGGNGEAGNGFWNSLDGGGNGSASPPAPVNAISSNNDDDDDILAAFSSHAPVDNSSHFPPPSSSISPQSGPESSGIDDLLGISAPAVTRIGPADPFDPFDVENLPSRGRSPFQTHSAPQMQADDDFEILGDLAKPLSELPPRPQPTLSPKPEPRQRSPPPSSDPRDPAIAEIMEMGFTAAQSKQALAETETGLDVQGAVGWLLEQAHRKSRPSAPPDSTSERPRQGRSSQSRQDSSRTRQDRDGEDASAPAWARGGKTGGGEKDIGAYAAEVGGTLFKSANSLWSTGRKKMERAVAELKADLADGGGDPDQPRWMRERQIREELEKRGARNISRHDRPPPPRAMGEDEPHENKKQAASITDEAMMLEMSGGPPQPRRKQREEGETPPPAPAFSRDSSMSERERIQRQRIHDMEVSIREKEKELRERELEASSIPDSLTRKAKLAADNQPAYVSRNRRRPPPASASPSLTKPATPEPDLLNGGSGNSSGGSRPGSSTLNPFTRDVVAERQRTPQPPAPITAPPPRPQPAPQQRLNVPLSGSALSQSSEARQKGTEAFKRGDYSAAYEFYTSALKPIPESHTLRIILLTNRSLCTLKLGNPRAALTDVESILSLIGESRGELETIALDGAEKDMNEYWLKAIARKAECFEQLEKWSDAKAAWELALTAGGITAAINGKRRCEAALKPKAPPKPKPKAPTPAPKRPTQPSAKSNGAVTALRQANADQERQEAERLELHDVVHERVGRWKNGKEGNLRALLAGLDTVLWEGSGWKKVGMAELLIPQKCKIAYMRGISKVHPDKIKQDATTEQRMISAAVFSLLNDSWDKFKAENGL